MTIDDLKNRNLILFEAIAGSKSFGLDTPMSDTDIKGVFYLPKEVFYGTEYIPQVSNETNDIVYYEIGRFVELLTKNNPNILELLASPQDCILYRHPVMEQLQLSDFLSKLCKETFAGYAATQIKKATGLKKKIVNLVDKERKSLADFCYILSGYSTLPLQQWLVENNLQQEQCGLVNIPHSKDVYALFTDTTGNLGYKGIVRDAHSNQVLLSPIPNRQKEAAYLYCNKDAYSSYCKEYREYWDWVEKRNQERYNTNSGHGKNYDSKNMMHTIRLLQSALHILTKGTLNVKVPNRDELLNIKAGNVEYDHLMHTAESLLNAIETAAQTSQLPPKPDKATAEKRLVSIRTFLYK
ncbi:nucleotidyltransferase [Flavobacterium akiainvivens]|uniref:Nucleotidyltransferase n=1 Tax=Flavobacterium akiainvivens TaxID=1202724 RepID=A0A0M9VI96_9FLAO|nr:nucleotidyltransferase domain-containing protein [Flavobacterium akiainvivens]KOS06466.1 nucleotidyltransferase [Flavobacterium akiainvivens]SFQ12922.1 Predicted nucleotidyltransferase [Flavobacterium akiainvivens]